LFFVGIIINNNEKFIRLGGKRRQIIIENDIQPEESTSMMSHQAVKSGESDRDEWSHPLFYSYDLV
jgi:hypothetical protein